MNDPLEMNLHSHRCIVYSDFHHFRNLASKTIIENIDDNNKCIVLVPSYTEEMITNDIKRYERDVNKYFQNCQLIILNQNNSYTMNGVFDPDAVAAFWESQCVKAVNEGFSGLFVAGEATFALDNSVETIEKLYYYENLISTRLFPHFPFKALCSFDNTQYDAEIIKAAITTHQTLYYDDELFVENIHHIPPEIYFSKQKSKDQVGAWLENLRKNTNNILALRESENRFRNLFQKAPMAYQSLNEDGFIIEVNDTWLNSLGYTRNQVIGAHIMKYLPIEWHDKFETNFPKFKEIGEIHDAEFELLKADGTSIFASFMGKIGRDTQGNFQQTHCIFQDITDQRRIENENRLYTQNLLSIFDSAPNSLILVDETARIVMINNKGVRFKGGERDALIGLRGGDALNCLTALKNKGCGRSVDCEKCPIRNRVLYTFSTGKPCVEEEGQLALLENGKTSKIDFLISTTLLRIQNTKLVLLSLTDITEYKKIKQQNIFFDQELESIFRSAPTGIGVMVNRKLLKINKQIERLTGYAEEELIGKHIRILYPSDSESDFVGEEKIRQIESVGIGRIETRWKRKNGTIIDVLMASTPIDFTDLSKGITFTVLDMTEFKKNKTALLKSELKYRTMMNAIEDPMFICSSEKYIEYMNPAMENWLGLNATGKHCYEAIWGGSEKCSWCQHEMVMEGESYSSEIHDKNREKIYYASSVPIYNSDGSISQLTSYRDITELKKLYSKVQQAQKLESIGSLAGGIAHDFNNILFPILGRAEMLLDDLPEGSSEWKHAQAIQHAGKRGAELAKQILSFGRGQEHILEPTKLQQVFKEVIKLIRSTIPKSISVEYKYEKECGYIIADSIQLHQIGMNLLTNAYHAVENMNGKINVTIEEVMLDENDAGEIEIPEGKYAKLSISDNGIGIPPENMQKIFDPYFTTKDKNKGTGLGLSVVYGIVKEHKGGIRIQSEVGKGTTFEIYFPLSEIQKPDEEKAETNVTPHGFLTEHLLLVDDELIIADIQKQMLERLGYKVSMRTSSIEALEAFKFRPYAYNLVVTDLDMPNLTGDQLALRMKSIRPDIPIIICTGYDEKIDNSKIQSMGINGFLLKPISKAKMAHTVRRVLDRKL